MLTSVLLLALTVTSPQATEATLYMSIDSPVSELCHPDGTVSLLAPGCSPGYIPGEPDIPLMSERVAIPEGSVPVAAHARAEVWEPVPGSYDVRPLPPPCPLLHGLDLARASLPDPAIYGTDAFWPETPVRLSGSGSSDGHVFADLEIRPLRYNPVTGELERLVSVAIAVATRPGGSPGVVRGDSEPRRMLIVTDLMLMPAFAELAQWRTDEGILTEVVSTAEVYSSTPGRDDAEKLRNYVIDYYQTDGLDFLLIGGDTDLLPFRKAYAMTCEAGMHSREDSLPCDLYFSDLDGDWDFNGNDVFGEVADSIDLYADVFVGRAPVESIDDAWAFVDKTIAYENVSETGFYQDALFCAGVLWSNPYTDSKISKNYIDEAFVPWYFDITKQYESEGTMSAAAAMIAMNEGTNFVNHDHHAWYSSLSMAEGSLGYDEMDALNSDGRYAAFMFSIGCWSAAFDFDAVGEHFVTNPNGGGTTYIGNSSYGWGSPGNPKYGYSDRVDQTLFEHLFESPGARMGQIMAQTKEEFIPYSHGENVYRWHQYQVNLLGDPALNPYRATPGLPTLECPAMVTQNTQYFPVAVMLSGTPVEGATVCIHDEGDNYLVTELDGSGSHTFELSSVVTGSMTVTVTGAGIARVSSTVPQATGPSPVISNLQIDDSSGDGHLSPGDDVHLTITLMNQGTSGMTGVELTATLASGPGTILEPWCSFGDLAPGGSAVGSEPIDVSVFESASTGQNIVLDLEITADQGTWDMTLPLLIYAPGIYYASYSIDDSYGGNDNGYPEPGETFDILANFANIGLQGATEVSVVMTDHPSWLTWDSDSAWVASIPPDGVEQLVFQATLDAAAPELAFPYLFMDISAQPFWSSEDTLRLTVGETGISEDVESGASGWTHSGTNDYWSIIDWNSHSPDHCWYCGDSGTYYPSTDCGLLSPQLVIAPDAALSFWGAFDVAIYGTDGLYVIIQPGGMLDPDTLDFIGSGGALGSGLPDGVGSDWLPHTYDLSGIPAGQTVQVEFRFVADDDSDTGVGFFIDDITVDGSYLGSMSAEAPGEPAMPILGMPCPNPSTGVFSVPVNVATDGEWAIEVFDLAGRLVCRRVAEGPHRQTMTLSLEADGERLSPGLYFVRLRTPGSAECRKLVLAGP